MNSVQWFLALLTNAECQAKDQLETISESLRYDSARDKPTTSGSEDREFQNIRLSFALSHLHQFIFHMKWHMYFVGYIMMFVHL